MVLLRIRKIWLVGSFNTHLNSFGNRSDHGIVD
jgi:hypothetical protein